MKTAEEMRKYQMKIRKNRVLPEKMKKLFEEYVETKMDEILFNNEDDDYNENPKFNKKFVNNYGIHFTLYDLLENYGLHKYHARYFMHYADHIVSKIRELGYTVNMVPYDWSDFNTNVSIEILWQNFKYMAAPPED